MARISTEIRRYSSTKSCYTTICLTLLFLLITSTVQAQWNLELTCNTVTDFGETHQGDTSVLATVPEGEDYFFRVEVLSGAQVHLVYDGSTEIETSDGIEARLDVSWFAPEEVPLSFLYVVEVELYGFVNNQAVLVTSKSEILVLP